MTREIQVIAVCRHEGSEHQTFGFGRSQTGNQRV